MDKIKYFTVFNIIAFGSVDTLRHSISPLVGTIGGLEDLRTKIFTNLKEQPVDATPEILANLDFEAFEKARVGFHSVGVSLIICFSELIKKLANDRAAATTLFGPNPLKSFEFYKIGPKIKDVHWAEAVVSASNYVRHDDEWQNLIKPTSYNEGGISYNLSYNGVDWERAVESFPPEAKRNVKCIGQTGIKYESFLRYNSIAGFEIANALELFDKDRALGHFEGWVTEVTKNLQQSLKIK